MLFKMSQWSFKRVLFLWALSGVSLFVTTAVMYLLWEGFGEQGQVNFAAVSHLLYQGYPLYVDSDFPARYSLQHGPLTFIITGGIMQLFGANFVTAKLSGILATAGALFVSWKWFEKIVGKQVAFLLVGLEIWMLFHWNYIYFIRPDSMLLLCTTVSLFILTTQTRPFVLLAGIAIPLAMAINLKIHGFLYFIPILVLSYPDVPRKILFSAIGISGIIAFSPYLLPGISIRDYWLVLTYSLEHGVRFANFIPKVAASLAIFLLPISFAYWKGLRLKPLLHRHKCELSSFLAVLFVVSLIASKDGSGTNHLMPFIPMFFYFYMQVILEYRKEYVIPTQKNEFNLFSNRYGIWLLVVTIIVTIGGFSTQKRLWNHIRVNDNRAAIQDIQQIQEAYPSQRIEIGYGKAASYNRWRDIIVVPVFNGNPLYLEYIALSDMHKAGVPIPQSTLKSLAAGEITIWLIPKGDAPFSMDNVLFDSNFKKMFFANYKLSKSTSFFDIWTHNKIENLDAVSPNKKDSSAGKSEPL